MKATWHQALLAVSQHTIVIEGNHYFPHDAINRDHFRPSVTHTTCSWKGEASYYDVVVEDAINKDAAWFYPDPKPAAANIKGYVAFWKSVQVE